MACRIAIEGRVPSVLGLSATELRAAASFFAAKSSARAGVPFREVAIVVQDDAASGEVHRGIMGVDGATDVITQRYDAIPPEPPGVYGELYVNADRAALEAERRGRWSAAREFLLYVAHGMDHLAGEDDATPRGYAAMRRRELSWLRGFFAGAEGER